MTAPTTETAPSPPRRGGNALTRKAGPLPVWAWGVVVLGGIGAIIILRRRQAATTTQSSTAGPTGAPVETAIPIPANVGISQSQYANLLSQDQALYEQILDMQGEDSKPRRDRDREEDRESRNQEEEENDRCPDGYHFLAVPRGSQIWPEGGRRVKGGFCVPDKKPRKRKLENPVP